MICGKMVEFKPGEVYKSFVDKEGYSYVVKNGHNLRYSYCNPEFLKHFEIIDEELCELLERLGEQ